jgi:hypothetical protein
VKIPVKGDSPKDKINNFYAMRPEGWAEIFDPNQNIYPGLDNMYNIRRTPLNYSQLFPLFRKSTLLSCALLILGVLGTDHLYCKLLQPLFLKFIRHKKMSFISRYIKKISPSSRKRINILTRFAFDAGVALLGYKIMSSVVNKPRRFLFRFFSNAPYVYLQDRTPDTETTFNDYPSLREKRDPMLFLNGRPNDYAKERFLNGI